MRFLVKKEKNRAIWAPQAPKNGEKRKKNVFLEAKNSIFFACGAKIIDFLALGSQKMINFSPPQAPKKSADFAENQPILEVLRMALFIRMPPPLSRRIWAKGGAFLISIALIW